MPERLKFEVNWILGLVVPAMCLIILAGLLLGSLKRIQLLREELRDFATDREAVRSQQFDEIHDAIVRNLTAIRTVSELISEKLEAPMRRPQE